MSLNKVAIVLSTGFWLVMMVFLFRADVLPNYQLADNPGYEAVVRTVSVPVVREMAVFKDTRTFLRDPAQWSQVLIFFLNLGRAKFERLEF